MSKFEPGSWIWFQSAEERFLPARVLKSFAPGEPATVRTEDGEDHSLNSAESGWCVECNPEALSTSIDDLINISDLNEMSILHNLRCRFKEDKIYTNISSILISVNPFKLLPLYTPEMLDKYRNGSRGLPPHVFATAYNSYNNMLGEGVDQSVVISGESGAGKSEATKLILQFLTDVSSRTSGAHTAASNSLEQQILAANPILEAFGNAKTLRNNNSSRFGKLITVNFDKNGAIIGGGIINYLLEKSRVVGHTPGERNYHIFYQLLSASKTNPELASELKLQDPEMYEFTNPRNQGVTHIEGHSDEKEFEDTQNSMDILRFSAQEKQDMFRIVAGVLHFGNVKFKVEKKDNGDDGSSISNLDVVQHACSLWRVDAQRMAQFLTARTLGTRSITLVAYSVQQSQDARDALVKKVYAELFQLVVDKINRELSATGLARHKFIGVLDIFGFESFEVNSFEQLCINFCNEKLQFHFNEHIFRMEQQLYAAEGINIPGSTFVDNQPTLDLLELKTTGVFSMVDEEISVPRGTDETLLTKLLQKHADKTPHPNMIKPKAKDCKDPNKCFGILHYAGPVFYNITAFLDKNKDQLHPDLMGVLKGSTLPLLVSMFPPEEGGGAAGGVRGSSKGGPAAATKGKTLGGQFKQQLNELIATLNSTYPHFVRCMKSNDKKVGNIFNAGRMHDQLKYAGLVEVCRIRKLGFPVRRLFDEFFRRFRPCNLTAPNLEAMLAFLSSKGVLIQGEWARGTSRIFLRTAQSVKLELYRESCLVQVAVVVQKYSRRMLARRRVKRIKTIIANVHAAISTRTEAALTSAIDMTFELPWNGAHLAVVKQAKALQLRVREENRVLKLLENAIASRDLNALKSAVSAAASLNPPVNTPLTAQAQDIIGKLEAEIAVKAGLTSAINARNLPALKEFLTKGQQINLSGPEMQQGAALRDRLEEEVRVIDAVKAAAARKNLDELNTCLNKCAELGLSSHPDVAAANEVKKSILASQGAAEQERQRQNDAAAASKREMAMQTTKRRLSQANASKNMNELNAALQEAIQLGLSDAEVTQAQALVGQLNGAGDARSLLMAVIQVLVVKAESGIYEADLVPLKGALASAEQLAQTTGEFPELADARTALKVYQKHIQARVDLDAAIATNERLALRRAVDFAENLEMTLSTLETAKDMLRPLELAYRAERIAAGEPVEDEEPYDAMEEARKRRQETARQAKYDHKNYANLRTPDDFAKGIMMGKSKVKEGFLTWQALPIPNSLCKLTGKEDPKTALEIHKDLLGYMGDKQMPFPAMLAQDVLKKGSEIKTIRDEIYMQIIKQLANNPRPESVAKGWQMMCMCVGTFPPSFDFENYLLHYILDRTDKGRGAVVDYAKYCLRTLEAMLSHGDGTGFVPQVDEILAYKERPPILATIYLVDGKPITEDLPITPDVNVGKVLELCTHWLTLTDPRISTLGIFVYDLGDVIDDRYDADAAAALPYADLVRTPRPLRNEDYMGDTIVQKARQRRMFKFVLKKKIFLPQHIGRGPDQFYERLLYLQAEDETIIQGNIDIPNAEQVSYLAAISMLVAFGEDLGNTVGQLQANGIMDFIVPAWRAHQADEAWANSILTHLPALVTQPPEDLQDIFLQIVQESPLYGSHWFYCHKVDPMEGVPVPEIAQNLPRDVMLAFNAEGMHIFCFDDDGTRQCRASFPFADIYRWGGSSSQFSLIMADEAAGDSFEFVIITSQAADMAAVILDHIRHIMVEQESEDAAAAASGK